jgi:hypothetical protein
MLLRVVIHENVSCKEVHVTNWRMKSQQEILLQKPTVSCDLTALGDTFWNDHVSIHEGYATALGDTFWNDHMSIHEGYANSALNQTTRKSVSFNRHPILFQ